MSDPFRALDVLTVGDERYSFYRLDALENANLTRLSRLPFSIRVLLESALRHCNDREVTQQDVRRIAAWKPGGDKPGIPFMPSRVIMQDFTGVPAIVDLAAMRSAVSRLGGDPRRINPLVPVDLVIDHSVQVDFFATPDALRRNAEIEFQRNRERYEFLKWGQKAFDDFRVVPPATGIVHQVNLEYLAQVVLARPGAEHSEGADFVAFPDTLVGTDSHTTMINGLGVVGWGVGGIEAEAAMLGQPIDMLLPEVIGFRLHGRLREGVTATDLVLTVTQMLRAKGVVDKFVEFFGDGLDSMSLPDRATIGNMAPEYGATIGFFPVDAETIRYLRATNRPPDVIERVEAYCQEQQLFRENGTPDPDFTDTLDLDLTSVVPSLAGPKRPHDRVALSDMREAFTEALTAPIKDQGFALTAEAAQSQASVGTNGGAVQIGHGAVVIAAITSCTNTSNPSVMVAAGLVAKKAVERGLKVPPYVKTSLAPGSRVVTEYLTRAGLIQPLAELGFNLVAYGCTTCIGNSGPLPGEVAKAISSADLVAVAVLSGNRNFEGRINPLVRGSYLASPPLVVAFGLAGRVDIDLDREPLGTGKDGRPVYLKDIWPTQAEISQTMSRNLVSEMFTEKYAAVFEGTEAWQAIKVSGGGLYQWDERSTYIHHPPFFDDMGLELPELRQIEHARVLAMFGDSVNTDNISPAGTIAVNSPAGQFLEQHGVQPKDFNSYGSRRGNDLVMARGTFANIRLKNLLAAPKEGNWTRHFPDGAELSIYEAAMLYKEEGVPCIVIAGKEYGTGSSRDWAAKGPKLQGVQAIIARSFERIHRSNLVGMGILPLCFREGESAESLGLKGDETYDIRGINSDMQPRGTLQVRAMKPNGEAVDFEVIAMLNTEADVMYYRNGGILQTVLRNLLR